MKTVPSLSETEAPEACAKHGMPMTRNLLFTSRDGRQHWGHYFCQPCDVEQRTAQRAEAELLERQERENAMLSRSGLQGRYRETRFENFEINSDGQQKVLAACRKFAQEMQPKSGGGLWLIGPVGTGKSHLGAAMVNHLIRARGIPARIGSLRQLIRDLRGTWRKDSDESEEEVIQAYGRAPLLVLDEVGVAFGTEAEQTQLFDVIDLRYQLRAPTVLLSNLPPDGLKLCLGERLFDRLREGARVLVCDWKSYRGA